MKHLGMPEGLWMGTVKVGDKYQIVIPKEARGLFGIEPGDVLLMMADKDRGIAIVPTEAYREFINAVLASPPADGGEDGA